ncbi:Uncharacterised protein [Vibrio cholerae]|nr:Uncharacterised protein [Vibrio cholerae]
MSSTKKGAIFNDSFTFGLPFFYTPLRNDYTPANGNR